MFFGSNAGIGWLSSTGTRSNLTWCVLTNAVQTNALLLRGSLCVDQTGIFSNNVIAVTSDSSGSAGLKGVWRVDAKAHPTLLANIDTRHLEGVTTLSNNVQKYGPWAGKIVTGDEDRGLIYTIDPNGAVTTNDTSLLIPGGIGPEDFEIIPPNQNLYICDASHTIYKFLAAPLSDYVGDVLVTQSGDGLYHTGGAKLFIFHWNAATTNFNIISFKCPIGQTEHVTFAPIDLPAIY